MRKRCSLAAALAVVLLLVAPAVANTLTFEITSQRSGWDPGETSITPSNAASVKHRWDSLPFASSTINNKVYAPHVYGAPLEIDGVLIRAGAYSGKRLSLVVVASTNGSAYAVNAFAQTGVPAGTIVWHTALGTPGIENFDGGMPLGVQSTGIIDATRGRWYLADHIHGFGWAAFALDLGSGKIIPGWPIALSSNVTTFDTNGSPGWGLGSWHSQRGALNLSLDGATLYVPMGSFNDDVAGWLVAIDTAHAALASSFSTTNSSLLPGASLWSSGGVSIGLNGMIYATTGNATLSDSSKAGVWGDSFLAFAQNARLVPQGSYTPWNVRSLDGYDADLGSGSAMLPPDLGATGTTTPHLAVFGGKQGVVYLLDLDHLPGGAVIRQPAVSAARDGSLKPPASNAPLVVFGPYCDRCLSDGDYAKMHSTPAYFATSAGQHYVFVTGKAKSAVGSTTTVPPCVARLQIMTPLGKPAYLRIDAGSMAVRCLSPGPPLVVGQIAPLVLVLDANLTRDYSLTAGYRPILRIFDARTMQQLWTSGTSLYSGGKFTLPTVSHGTVFVATDRLQAFSL